MVFVDIEDDGFRQELQHIINKYSQETESGTPDFILAEYMFNCLKAYEKATVNRDKWYSPTL